VKLGGLWVTDLMNFSIYKMSNGEFDLTVHGSGMWYSLHMVCANSMDAQRKQMAVDYINILLNKFPCDECKWHMREYIVTHPLEPVSCLPNHLLLWSVDFHNSVNARLGRPLMGHDVAIKRYGYYAKYCTTCGQR
jgi:hypothetical protein